MRTHTPLAPAWVQSAVAVMEGTKQALAILKDERAVRGLAGLDPTPTKKYVTVMARLLKAGTSMEKLETLTEKIRAAEAKRSRIDLTRIKTFNELDAALTERAHALTKATRKRGIDGLVEGKHYIDGGVFTSHQGQRYHALVPCSFDAMEVLMSARVGGVEGEWCVGNHETWRRYMTDEVFFVVFIDYEAEGEDSDRHGKLCLMCSRSGYLDDVYDALDYARAPDYYFDRKEVAAKARQWARLLPADFYDDCYTGD